MSIFREPDTRMMRDRDASAGDRGNGGDLETLTSGTSVPPGASGTEGYGDQDTGMGTGYSSGGQMSGSGRTGGSADAGDSGNRGRGSENTSDNGPDNMYSSGAPLPDSGGPDVSDMGENEPNTSYGSRSGRPTDMGGGSGMMGDSQAGADSGASGVGMGTGTGGNSALDMGTSTGTGGNWGDPGSTTSSGLGKDIPGTGLGKNTTTSGQNLS